MGKSERVVLWVIVGVVGLWLLILTLVVVGELSAIHATLPRTTAGVTSLPGSNRTPTPPASLAVPTRADRLPQIGVSGARIVNDSVAMTVTVRYSGGGDLLYEPPVLVSDDGQAYAVTPDSLERARYTFLDLVTRGQATARLAFVGSPASGVRLTLVFNAGREATDILAPRIEASVPVTP